MNKDTVVASLIGFGLGLIAAISLWVLPRVIPKKSSPVTTTVQENQENAAQPAHVGGLQITIPKDGDITKTNTVKLSGTAPDKALLVVTTAQESQVIPPPKDGNFETTLSLKEGVNEIYVAALSNDQEIHQSLSVFYFDQDL